MKSLHVPELACISEKELSQYEQRGTMDVLFSVFNRNGAGATPSTGQQALLESIWFSVQAIAGLQVGVPSVNPNSSAAIIATSTGVDPDQKNTCQWTG
jgi:hypothetical protein